YDDKGQLVRVEIAENLQAIDYVYNLNGQLKSINHPSLNSTKDPVNNKYSNSGFPADLFGMSIDYNENDYSRSTTNIETTTFGQDQYNGNIKGVRWNNSDQILPGGAETTYQYHYNKNNWL